jgi:hypothetical protein
MPRKPAKKVQDEAIKMIEGTFLGLGAERVEQIGDSYFDRFWTLETTGGLLKMTASDYEFIHCVFDDVEAARKVMYTGPSSRLNPHSGKWNWHFYVTNIEETLAQFAREVRALTN